jgi:hypothetical protein
MSISPRRASLWLKNNTRNRKLTESLVNSYARAMTAGEWLVNGKTIVFDGYPDKDKCRLMDGQHRLEAIVRSGVTIESFVVFGADPESFHTLDTGKRRTFADVLGMMGHSNCSSLAAGVRWVWRYLNGMHRTHMRIGYAPLIHELLATLKKYPELAVCAQTRGPRLLPPGLCLFARWLLSKPDKPTADIFFARLGDGADLGEDSPIRRLRSRLEQNRGSRTSNLKQEFILALTFKAWNLWRQNQETQSLSWRAGTPYPDPIDV